MDEHIDTLHQLLRTQIVRGVVLDVDDTGGDQLVTVRTHYGVVRAKVEVAHPFGLATNVPLDGAVVHVFANAGDPADLVALPPRNPSSARMGNLGAGDAMLYDSMGQKVYLKGGKIVLIDCASELQVRIGGTTVLDVTADGATLSVPLDATQGIKTTKLTASDDVVAGDASISLVGHKHPVSGSMTGTPE
ncbi:phage baseplate assembly protein domain-containing protein [Brytella acorum]|uniref:Phage baseplate assembly protein n=1 Tax=Brytella acorum TaxID=2959299 RepID=A0AA35UVW7_9PROT|nr:phage baseplate assembly protein [Brytella acorum]CAI9120458.1 phage baseplate assembly protein [Brytella acorum]